MGLYIHMHTQVCILTHIHTQLHIEMLNKLKIKAVREGIDQNLKHQEASVTLLIKEGGTPDS